MSSEQASQQRKQTSAPPAALSKLGSGPEPRAEPEAEPRQPAAKAPEHPPLDQEHHGGADLPPEAPTTEGEPATHVEQEPEAVPNPPTAEEEGSAEGEPQRREPPALPHSLSHESAKPSLSPAKEEPEGPLPTQHPPPAEQKHQLRKQPSHWTPK